MVLFSLFAVPLFCCFIVSQMRPGLDEIKDAWVQYSRGVLSFIPAYILYAVLKNIIPLTYSRAGIYFYYFYHDSLFFGILGVLAYLLVNRLLTRGGRPTLSSTFVFLSGFYTFNTVLEIVRHYGAYNGYLLLLYPVMQIVVVMGLSLVTTRALEADRLVRNLLIVAGIGVVAATATIPLLFTIHYFLFSVLVAVVLFVAAFFPYLLLLT